MCCWQNPCRHLPCELPGADHRRDNENSAAVHTAEEAASAAALPRSQDLRDAKRARPFRRRLRCPPIRAAQYPTQDFESCPPPWDFFAATIRDARQDCAVQKNAKDWRSDRPWPWRRSVARQERHANRENLRRARRARETSIADCKFRGA